MASLMIILRDLIITNFRGKFVVRLSKWIIIKYRSFEKKSSQKWVIKLMLSPSPQSYEEASQNSAGDQAKLSRFLCSLRYQMQVLGELALSPNILTVST